MKMLITGATIALSMFIGTSALAAKPASGANCESLGETIAIVDAFLEANNIEYPNLGELVSTAILDPTTAGDLVYLVNLFYAGDDFTSAKQIISTAAGCGLTPHLIAQIND